LQVGQFSFHPVCREERSSLVCSTLQPCLTSLSSTVEPSQNLSSWFKQVSLTSLASSCVPVLGSDPARLVSREDTQQAAQNLLTLSLASESREISLLSSSEQPSSSSSSPLLVTAAAERKSKRKRVEEETVFPDQILQLVTKVVSIDSSYSVTLQNPGILTKEEATTILHLIISLGFCFVFDLCRTELTDSERKDLESIMSQMMSTKSKQGCIFKDISPEGTLITPPILNKEQRRQVHFDEYGQLAASYLKDSVLPKPMTDSVRVITKAAKKILNDKSIKQPNERVVRHCCILSTHYHLLCLADRLS